MLTRITAVTGALTAVLNAVVLLGWWNLTAEEVSGVTFCIVAVGGAIHAWFNPDFPVSVTPPPGE